MDYSKITMDGGDEHGWWISQYTDKKSVQYDTIPQSIVMSAYDWVYA